MENYKTRDLYVAAYMLTKKEKLIGTEPAGERRGVYFVFADKSAGELLELEYINDTATCNVRAYVNALDSLKTRLFGK